MTADVRNSRRGPARLRASSSPRRCAGNSRSRSSVRRAHDWRTTVRRLVCRPMRRSLRRFREAGLRHEALMMSAARSVKVVTTLKRKNAIWRAARSRRWWRKDFENGGFRVPKCRTLSGCHGTKPRLSSRDTGATGITPKMTWRKIAKRWRNSLADDPDGRECHPAQLPDPD